MYASLSLGNPLGTVWESNGAMLVLVNIVGQLYTDIKVIVASVDGNGKNYFT